MLQFDSVRRGAAAAFVAAPMLSAPSHAAPPPLSEEKVTAAVKQIIAERSDNGVFRFRDARAGEDLDLVLDDVRIVRGLPKYGWFPNVVFHAADAPKKKYALDFWLKPDGEELKLQAIRIHKVPQPDGDGWMSITRSPLPWWWLPTLKRASAAASMPAWEVMGAVHAHVLKQKKDDAVIVQLAGQDVQLELIDIHQPVGKTGVDGRYFACVEFQKLGSPTSIYFADYWLEPKSRSVSMGSVTPMREALTDASKAASEPRCDIKGAAFEVVD